MCIRDRNCIDMVITDLGVFERKAKNSSFRVTELAQGVSLDEVKDKTTADIIYE